MYTRKYVRISLYSVLVGNGNSYGPGRAWCNMYFGSWCNMYVGLKYSRILWMV